MTPEQQIEILQQQSAAKLTEFKSAIDEIITEKIKDFCEKQSAVKEPEEHKKGKALNEYIILSKEFTSAASTVNRSLALGGLGIIWIFIKPETHLVNPAIVNIPLVSLAISLGIDLLQYFFGAISWKIFYRVKFKIWKKSGFNNQYASDIEAPDWITGTIDCLWLCKILAMGVAYFFLINFLFTQIK